MSQIQFTERFQQYKSKCAIVCQDHATSSNGQRMSLFASLELLRIEVSRETSAVGQFSELLKEIEDLQKMLNIQPAYKSMNTWGILDTIVRFLATVICLTSMAVAFSIPLLLIQQIDRFVEFKYGVSQRYKLSEFLKKRMALVVMLIAGVHLTIEGLDPNDFQDSTVLMFSHSSNLDSVAIAASIPVSYKALVKTDVFLLPFFSWLALVFGGIPIDRKNRDKAVATLRAAAASSKHGEVLAISPEGTRSVTGQLGAFKKGPFYLAVRTCHSKTPHLCNELACLCVVYRRVFQGQSFLL